MILKIRLKVFMTSNISFSSSERTQQVNQTPLNINNFFKESSSDLISLIFDFVNLNGRDLCHLSMTCKEFYNDNHIWKLFWKKFCKAHGLVVQNQNDTTDSKLNYRKIFKNLGANLLAREAYQRVFGDVVVPPIPNKFINLASDVDLGEVSLTLIPDKIKICVQKTFPFQLIDTRLSETRLDYFLRGFNFFKQPPSYRANPEKEQVLEKEQNPEKEQNFDLLEVPVSIRNLEYISAAFLPGRLKNVFLNRTPFNETVAKSHWCLQKISSLSSENRKDCIDQLMKSSNKIQIQMTPLIDRYMFVILNFFISGKKIDDGKIAKTLPKDPSRAIESCNFSILSWKESSTGLANRLPSAFAPQPELQIVEDSSDLLRLGLPMIDQHENLVNAQEGDFSRRQLASTIQILPQDEDDEKNPFSGKR